MLNSTKYEANYIIVFNIRYFVALTYLWYWYATSGEIQFH